MSTVSDYMEAMPKWLGMPLYPLGSPILPDEYSYNDRTIREIYYTQQLNEEDEKLLIAYVLYYINAPLFKLGWGGGFHQELIDKAGTVDNLDDLIMLCMEFGLDPL